MAAQIELIFCQSHASDGTGNGAFNQSLLTGGAAESGEFDPAMGLSSASWLKIPHVDDEITVDGASIRALVWDDGGWEWMFIEQVGLDDHGMVSFDIGLSEIHGHVNLDSLELLIEWHHEGNVVYYTPLSLDFATPGDAADFDRDGTVSVTDLASYLDAYTSSAPRADFNSDGVINAQDLSVFLAAFDTN